MLLKIVVYGYYKGIISSRKLEERWSGTHDELREKYKKMEKAARQIVERHRQRDQEEQQSPTLEAEERKLAAYRAKIKKIKAFLATASKKLGASGNERRAISPTRTAPRCRVRTG